MTSALYVLVPALAIALLTGDVPLALQRIFVLAAITAGVGAAITATIPVNPRRRGT